jgi:hypothetical protein
MYTRWGTPSIFKISPVTDPALDAFLQERGYHIEHDIYVMTADLTYTTLPDIDASGLSGLHVTVMPKVNDAWINALFALKKTDNDIMLDCAAIAKGYGCDVVAKILADKGVDNYMVDIGGEVVTKGISPKRLPWKIGVTKPIDDSLTVNQEIQSILNVTDKSMATSGNYRNFYYKNGRNMLIL